MRVFDKCVSIVDFPSPRSAISVLAELLFKLYKLQSAARHVFDS